MRFRVLFAVASASTIAACSLFSGLEGYSGGEGGSGPDGSADTSSDTSTGANDGALDSGGDGTASDAGTDASRFCANKNAAVCEDFDDDDPLIEWAKTVDPGASFALVTDRVFSAPRAVRAGLSLTNKSRGGFITRNLSGSGVVSHARLSYSLLVEERPDTGEYELNILRFNCGAECTSDFYVAISSTVAYAVEQKLGPDASPVSNYYELGAALPTGQWVRVEMEVVLTGTRTMVVKVDGSKVLEQATTVVGPGVANVHAGITYAASDVKNGSIVVDDVLFEIIP